MAINYTLLALLSEAAGDEDEENDAAQENDEGTPAEGEDATTDTEGGEENEGEGDDEEENNGEDEEEQTEEPTEDDFSMDPTEEEDDGPPPDGLTDPDDDGTGDEEDITEETNVQTNILNISKLDRVLAKRKCYSDYMDLRTSINTCHNIIDANEAILNPEIRGKCTADLDLLYTNVTDYLQFKFTINNYEENLKNYLIFVKRLDEIVKVLRDNGLTKV